MQKRKSVFLLILLLLLFLGLVCFLPLSKAVQIGGDEGFELAKATLCQKGFKLYTDVWNDQPPLHTFLITKILDHLTPSVAGPRLLTVGFSVLLLTSFFFICNKYFGVWIAVVGTGMLLAAPIFLEIGVSCMLEVPAMAPALAMIWVLSRSNGAKLLTWREVLAGALLAISS